MKFTDLRTNSVYNTDDYLDSFVDEYTGEVKEGIKVLNKRIRKLWFLAEHPNVQFIPKVEISSLGEGYNTENLDEYKQARKEKQALAYVQLYDDGKKVAENYALRSSFNKDGSEFLYFVEAAINAAIDRCIIDLGYLVPEEIEKSQKTQQPNVVHNTSVAPQLAPAPVQSSIAEIEKIVDEETNSVRIPSTIQTNANSHDDYPFDRSTPVEEILKHLTLQNARAYVFTCNGKHKGKTVGEVYESDKDKSGFSKTLNWFATTYKKDNILVAACMLVNKNK